MGRSSALAGSNNYLFCLFCFRFGSSGEPSGGPWGVLGILGEASRGLGGFSGVLSGSSGSPRRVLWHPRGDPRGSSGLLGEPQVALGGRQRSSGTACGSSEVLGGSSKGLGQLQSRFANR